jgi:hypothetical protein
MSRASGYWTAVVVVCVLGVAVQLGMFSGAKPNVSDGHGDSRVARVASPALGQSDSVNTGPSSVSHLSGTVRPSGPITDPALAKPDTNQGNRTRQVLGTDTSVIGTPFSVSKALVAACKRDDSLCPGMYKTLTKLAQEPRDNAWASQTEAIIQNQIESQGPDKYSIRSLECRTTVCAVEVTSLFGPYSGLRYSDDVKYSLRTGLGTVGAYETDPFGARVTVTLMTFTRHQHLCPINPCDLSSTTPP